MSHMYTLLECESVLEDEESTFKPFLHMPIILQQIINVLSIDLQPYASFACSRKTSSTPLWIMCDLSA